MTTVHDGKKPRKRRKLNDGSAGPVQCAEFERPLPSGEVLDHQEEEEIDSPLVVTEDLFTVKQEPIDPDQPKMYLLWSEEE